MLHYLVKPGGVRASWVAVIAILAARFDYRRLKAQTGLQVWWASVGCSWW